MQSYVSPLLSHFVGREKSSERAREILISILEARSLRRVPGVGGPVHGGVMISPDWSPHSEGEFLDGDWVCFCDLPQEQLGIHVGKYGRHGIAFRKEFLLPRGANPVFYIDRRSQAYFPEPRWRSPQAALHGSTPISLGAEGRIDGLVRALQTVKAGDFPAPPGIEIPPWVQESRDSTECLMRIVEMHFMAFVKPFDSTLSEEDEKNYYMEREWRVLGEVSFTLDDVAAIYVSPDDEAEFRENYPEITQVLVLNPESRKETL